MAVKKISTLNAHENPSTNENEFDIENYMNVNWEKIIDVVDNNADELIEAQEKQEEQSTAIQTLDKEIKLNSDAIEENSKSIEELTAENTALKEELERQKEDNRLNGLTEDNEGELLHITNTTGARFNSLEIFGNEKQKTREGYNKLENHLQSQTINGVNIVINSDKSITLNGTATAFFQLILLDTDDTPIILSPKTYTMSLKGKILGINFVGTENGVDVPYLASTVTTESVQKTYQSETTITKILCAISQGTQLNNVKLYPMIYEGTDEKEYEEYGAMPSFDYPSEVKAVGNNINIYNEKTAELNKYISGTLGELGTSSLSKVSDYIELTEDEYVINFTNDSNLRGYSFFDINKKFVSGEDNKKAPYTVQKPTNAKYIRFAAPINALDVKIEEGNQATPYSPYNMGSVEIDVVNKNWLKLEDIEETTSKGITYSCKKGILKIQGTATAGVQINLAYNIVLKPNTYNHSVNTIIKGLYLSFDNIRDTMLNQQNGITKTFNIDIEKTYSKYFLWIDANTTVDLELKPQLEIGEQATSYVEHQSQTKIMPIQQEMLEGDYISDIEHHGWKKKILNGTDVTDNGGTFAEFQANGNIARTISIPDLLVTNVRYDIKCEELPARGESVWAGVDYGINTYIGQAKILVSIPIEEIKTVYENELTVDNYVAAFNAYLSAKPITIYYKLATPIDLELTEEQKIASEQIKQAHTYKEVTNVYTEDEVGAIIKTNTNVDLKSIINNIQEQLIAE